MGFSSLTVPEEYELVASFNRELCTVLDSQDGKQQFALEFYYTTLKAQHDYAAANVIAISAAVECYTKELGIAYRDNKELAALRRLSRSVERGSVSETEYRKRCSTATLVAIWSWDTVVHYCWNDMGAKSLASLVKVAKKYPRWEQFVTIANSCMIRRHEDSVNDAEISSIGYHDPRSTSKSKRSPLEPRDITLLLAGMSEAIIDQSQQRISRWIRPCKCLEIQGYLVTDEQLSKRALARDRFGMLIRSEDPVKRAECCQLCERPPATTAGKRPMKGLKDGNKPLKRPRFGTLTVPKPLDPPPPSPDEDLFTNDSSEEENSDLGVVSPSPGGSDDSLVTTPKQTPTKDDSASYVSGLSNTQDLAARENTNQAASSAALETLDPASNKYATQEAVSPCRDASPAHDDHLSADDGLAAPLTSAVEFDVPADDDCHLLTPPTLPLLSGSRKDTILQVEHQSVAGGAFGPCSPALGWRPLDGEPFARLPTPSPVSKTRSAVFRCPQCRTECTKCVVPGQFGSEEANKRYQIAHEAHNLARSQKTGQIQNWMSPIRFARLHFSDDLLRHVDANQVPLEDADACVWSWAHFKERANAHVSFSKPIIIKQEPPDVHYDLLWFLRRLRTTYAGKSLSAQRGRDRAPQRIEIEALARHLTSDKPASVNVLSLDDVTFATKPHLTRMDRFTLLERLVNRARVDQSDDPSLAQKSVWSSACDVQSCTHFNILASRGAFSAPHRDSMGGTWIHMLFGSKLWWIVSSLADTDVEELHQQIETGRPWHPQGRERALILEANDVLVMPHEYPVLHAVLTLEPTLAHGGMFWDDEHIESVLRLLVQNAKNRHCTNEPMAFQLPAIVDGLRDLISHEGVIPDTNDHRSLRTLIDEFNSLRCDCDITSGTCEQDTCPCFADGRRCWSICGSHPEIHSKVTLAADDWSCMSEDPF